MMMYDFEVVYKRGISNIVTDTLSRRPCRKFEAIFMIHTNLFDRIQTTWTLDHQLVQLFNQLQQGTK